MFLNTLDCKLLDIAQNLKQKTSFLNDEIGRLKQENLDLQRNVIKG